MRLSQFVGEQRDALRVAANAADADNIQLAYALDDLTRAFWAQVAVADATTSDRRDTVLRKRLAHRRLLIERLERHFAAR